MRKNLPGNLRVLVTCGPTWVAVDDVRVLSNVSTGEMGHAMAEAFSRAGAKVTVIEGAVTHQWNGRGVRIIPYRFFNELAAALKKEAGRHDVIVHAAAVSDFQPARAFKGKLSSDKPWNLDLVPARKLIQDLKHWSPESFLVGFKLEPTLQVSNLFSATKSLFTDSGCDLVIANTLKRGYRGFIINADGEVLAEADSRMKIAAHLARILL